MKVNLSRYTLVEKLKIARAMNIHTQMQAAEEMGMSKSSLALIEAGTRKPTPKQEFLIDEYIRVLEEMHTPKTTVYGGEE